MKLKKFLSITGQKNYWTNIFIDMRDEIKAERHFLKRHTTYYNLFGTVAILAIFTFKFSGEIVYLYLSLFSVIGFVLNYFVKIYRFGTKNYRWFD